MQYRKGFSVLCSDTEQDEWVTILSAPCTNCQPALRTDTERVREVTVSSALCTHCPQPLAALPLRGSAKQTER